MASDAAIQGYPTSCWSGEKAGGVEPGEKGRAASERWEVRKETDPSPAKQLAAGQRGEPLEFTPILDRCRAVNVPQKGRGLVAKAATPANSLLLLEPAVASGATYAEVAAELQRLIDSPDDILLSQVLDLCAWGEAPTSVPELDEGGASTCMVRQPPKSDDAKRAAAHDRLAENGVELDEKSFVAKLAARLQLVAQANAFRSACDPLGALAWHVISPKEQQAVAEQNPDKVPVSRLWLFLRASLLNHSELPNANWLVAGGAIAVRAARDIAEGEEVLLSYWPDVDAADALKHGLLSGFGLGVSSVGEAPELSLSKEQLCKLAELKSAPFEAAQCLAHAGESGDPAVVFDSAAASLSKAITAAEKELPKQLRAFLEPRAMQVQLTLQQGAVLSARGDPGRGDQLKKLGLMRLHAAFRDYPLPWGKRVLLRLLFVLKGCLRPSPAELLSQQGEKEGESSNFSIQLAKQAQILSDELLSELERAVEAVFGDARLLPAVLSKCSIVVPTE